MGEATEIADGTHGTYANSDSGVPLLSAKNVHDGIVSWNDSDRRISLEDYRDIIRHFEPRKDDVLLTIVGSVGQSAILITNERLAFQRSVAFLRCKKSIIPTFLYSTIATQQFQTQLNNRKASSAQSGIYLNELSKVSIWIPTESEQYRIGEFFSTLDSLIAAAERQESLLRRKKQAYLQLMFPQEGETEPRLRFAGFSGEWEQRQLGDIAEIAIGQSPEGKYSNNGQNGVALAQGNTDIVNGVFVPRVWTTRPTKVVPAGTLLVSVRAPVGDVAVTPVQACIGRGFAGITGNGFLRYSLERLKVSGHWDRVSSGSVLDAITSKELLQTPISITSNQEEQRIGKFFTRLDYHIEIVERQVATLETMKRAYLQRMFI